MKEEWASTTARYLSPSARSSPTSNGNYVARWIDGGRDDHFAHAEGYCLVAGKRHLFGDAWDGSDDAADDYEPPAFKGLFSMTF